MQNKNNLQTRPWHKTIVPGDVLVPSTQWNGSSPRRMWKLPDRCVVLEVKVTPCQSGLMVKVGTVSGAHICLDAAWFSNRVKKGYKHGN